MENKRKRYSAEFKFKVALEAIKERQTMSELTTKFGVHSTQIGLWKKQLLQEGMEVFKEEIKGKKKISNHCLSGCINKLVNYR